VRLRTIKPSYSPMHAFSSSADRLGRCSTCSPWLFRNRSSPGAAMVSLTRMRINYVTSGAVVYDLRVPSQVLLAGCGQDLLRRPHSSSPFERYPR